MVSSKHKKIAAVPNLYAEIDLEAARKNLALVKERVGENTAIMAVVKADAYSHGAVELAHTFLKGGAKFLAVANVEEGIKLRSDETSITSISPHGHPATKNSCRINSPIIVLNPILPEEVDKILEYELTPTVDNLRICKLLDEKSKHGVGKPARQTGKKVHIHVEVDTGMGRGGFFPGDVVSNLTRIKELKNIVIEGIFTHFPSGEDKDFTMRQIAEFKEILLKLEEAQINIPYKHSANSAGVLNYPESFFNMVRPGLCLYGIFPFPSVNRSIAIKPVLTLKSKVTQKREVPAGATLSYGRTHTTTRKVSIGTIPIGYSHGYDRRLSNKADVLVRGKRCHIVGTICMDRCLVDLTNIPQTGEGEEIILIGKQVCHGVSGEQESISVEELAVKAGTISHEIVSRLKVPRIYTTTSSVPDCFADARNDM